MNDDVNRLLKKAEKLFCTTPTTLLVQIGGSILTVDWETGRITGTGSHISIGSNLPVYLRKHPDLAPLGRLLRRPIISSSQSHRVHFQGNDQVTIDIRTGAAWLRHGEHDFRLVSRSQLHSIKLPDQLQEGFSVWLNEANDEGLCGLVAVHNKEGTPIPAFVIDNSGVIRPLQGNTRLRLAEKGYYPEAQLFSRWGVFDSSIMVWLDDEANVAELHLPLNNGESFFTRVIRSDKGEWMIDGLDVQLEATHEAVPAFAGHTDYLVAKNGEGQRLLLLPGATPYEIQKRREKQSHEVDWNQILASGAKEGIHQYRIMPSGQIEGLTVSDNLLLMLWTLYMGHYPATAELAKRWLTPPEDPIRTRNSASSLIGYQRTMVIL